MLHVSCFHTSVDSVMSDFLSVVCVCVFPVRWVLVFGFGCTLCLL